MGFRTIGHRATPDGMESTPDRDLRAELVYVGVAERDYRAQWPMDALPGYELACVLEGSLWLWLDEQCLCAGPGDVFVVPPRTRHREETPPDSFTEAIYLGAVLRSTSGRERLFPLPLAALVHVGRGHVVEQRLRQIVTELQADQPGCSPIVDGAVLEIFYHLARASAGDEVRAGRRREEVTSPGFATEAQDYLNRRYAEPLTIDEVARHFHFSRQYFTKLFRRLVGQSPHAYLTEVRLREARVLLEQTTLPIHEIAARVGFADPYYFTRTFRQHLGLTPTQYRRRGDSPPPPGSAA